MHELKRAELKARATVRVKVSSESVECAARHFGTNPVVTQISHVRAHSSSLSERTKPSQTNGQYQWSSWTHTAVLQQRSLLCACVL